MPTPLRSTFQYRLTARQLAPPGARVIVPFGNRKLVGVVTGSDTEAKLADHKIRDVVEVLSTDLCLTGPILKLCEWAADYYNHPIGDVVTNALPTLIRKGGHPRAPVESLTVTSTGSAVELTGLNRSPAQQNLLLLLKSRSLSWDELKQLDISSRTIRVLIDKGWAAWVSQTSVTPSAFQLNAVNDQRISLSTEQQQALMSIGRITTYLLQGVTGSGKTEIYFRLIAPILKVGKQVLFLVPEIGLTPQTISRFKARFDVQMAVLHSSLSDRERATGWLEAKEGSVGIVLGTRSAVFTPLANPGIIIVDEEHDTSYKQQDG
ncbi:MAG: DEAD/DEAH box helicase family protein, partial [Pseudomonadales bacterium]|nr:DEAD/DEAH box helicase family protein [Pseudomonadales bacterium]